MADTNIQPSDDCKRAEAAAEKVERAAAEATGAAKAVKEHLEAERERATGAENAARNACAAPFDATSVIFPHLARRLKDEVKQGVYSELAAYVLSVASTWAYSDPEILEGVMRYLGFVEDPLLPTNWASRSVRNGPLLVETTATFLQAGGVVILCFRGTEPTNILAWLSDMSFEMDRFHSWGNVHSGFYRALAPIWPFITSGLYDALQGRPVGESYVQWPSVAPGAPLPLPQVHEPGCPCAESIAEMGRNLHAIINEVLMVRSGLAESFEKMGAYLKNTLFNMRGGRDQTPAPMEALYICGHSLGAAQALLTAAMIHQNPEYACVQKMLRGVYCYGQPLIGDQEFCDACEEKFGKNLFRHVYEGDIITHFPPKLYGAFRSFGQEYVSTPRGWTHRRLSVDQTRTLIASVALGAFSWVAEQVPVLRQSKALLDLALRPLNLPVLSLADHSPRNYINCSQLSLPLQPNTRPTP